MNPKNKSKGRSDSGEATAIDVPSPFELAQTAIALCQLRYESRHGIPSPNPVRFFKEAKTLLAEARSYLERGDKDMGGFIAGLSIRLGAKGVNRFFRAGLPASFSDLLREKKPESAISGQSRSNEQMKKHRTWVGSITTENGLEKAIRRYFSKVEAARIIRAKAMTENERNYLLEKQKQAVQRRAAKRVKGVSIEKSQAG
jgi:hypothetical protein